MKYDTDFFIGTDIGFFLQNLDEGGAERAIVALAEYIAKQGGTVDLVVGDADSDYRSEVSTLVRIENFDSRFPLKVFLCLINYLRRRNPTVVMSALDVANIMLIIAAMFARYKGRIVISQRAVVEASLSDLPIVRRMLIKFLQRICFPKADVLISNSYAAANEIRDLFGVSTDRIFTIHNALDVDRIKELAREQLLDKWFLNNNSPLIVSVGSLTTRKDMSTLIRAFAKVKQQREVRLAIIGKGYGYQSAEVSKIKKLIVDLELRESVYLPGFDANPYKWISAASVFVSSSIAEGFPNAIAEALALGRPIVATDCPGDTAEILEHGKWGRLVPVGEPESMAAAIMATLEDPKPPDGRIRAADFSPVKNARAYLKALIPELGSAAAR